MFLDFPLETVLKSLARIITAAKKKDLTEHYRAAKTLLDKTAAMMNLQYRDIALWTLGAVKLSQYTELEDRNLSQEAIQSKFQLGFDFDKVERY